MSKRELTVLVAVFLCGLLLVLSVVGGPAGVVLANGPAGIDWDVIGGGGGHTEAGMYTLDGTIGQPVVGMAANGGAELCSGFWCGVIGGHRIFLPLVLRNY
jgi:hypothetical protein